jgi:glutathione synthase/RimK-type ligase-like ATP-grasp enzyme
MRVFDNDDTGWPARPAQELRLREIDGLLRIQPCAIDAQIERANLLNMLDRRIESRDAFLKILQHDPTNFRALNEFGNLLSSMGHIAAACRVYAEAIKHHPNNSTGHVNLANLLLQGGNLEKARKHYEIALRINPKLPEGHQGLGAVLSAVGDRSGARIHFKAGFCGRSISTLPYRGAGAPITLLKLVSSGDGNIPTSSFLDDRIFMTSVIVTDFFDHSVSLPLHQVIFNAIGDADLCVAALDAAAAVVRRSGAPVINNPSAVAKTGRAANAKRLARLPHVRTPRMLEIPRALLASTDGSSMLQNRGLGYPVLLRSPGFHTGHNFLLVNDAAELQPAAYALPGDELLAIEYLDAREDDGNTRKYRAMIVDGRIYPLHAAVSQQWKVHYFTADMADNSAHRSEDAAFLTDMSAVIGSKAMLGLRYIRDALSLDYGGIDFGLGANGEVLLFEANATMVVNPPDAGERWDYRRPAVSKILDSVNAMILRKATPTPRQKAG